MIEQKTPLRLNTKRTFIVGFAFFGILMLWQIYYYYVPLFIDEMLQSRFGGGEGKYNYIIGLIMSVDNLLAIGLIPLFGWLSDRTKTRYGRRMPFIMAGTAAAVLLFPLLAVMFIIDSLVGLLVIIVLLVISMHFYRSPAVSLMPDVTPKPLRAAANGIINFVGYIGSIIGGVMSMLFLVSKPDTVGMIPHITENPNLVFIPFIVVSALMLTSLVVLIFKFRENKVLAEVAKDMVAGETMAETIEAVAEDKPLGKHDRRNFIILFGCILLWFFAFNSMMTFGSLYASKEVTLLSGAHKGQWQGIGLATSVMAIAGMVTFLPAIKLSKKIGRKSSILIGLAVMIATLFAASFMTTFGFPLLVLFAFAGAGWAIINLNSYPMLVEMSSTKNIGRITGYYYIAVQISQSITSICIGFVLDWLTYAVYFPYAVLFMSLAFTLCLFFKTKKVEQQTSDQIQPVGAE